MEKLLPCPFCGHDEIKIKSSGMDIVSCRRCLGRSIGSSAVERWNRRSSAAGCWNYDFSAVPEKKPLLLLVINWYKEYSAEAATYYGGSFQGSESQNIEAYTKVIAWAPINLPEEK